MQRTLLRTITVMTVMCLCYLAPNKITANHIGYGPNPDLIISEESEKISLTCPPPITVDCDANGIYTSFAEFEAAGGSVNLPNGCVVDSFTFVADVEISQNGCAFIYFREYFISSSCGSTFTCNQLVMLEDDDTPVIINVPNDTTLTVTGIPCTAILVVDPPVTASDGCSGAMLVNDAPSEFPIGMTTVTYTATDSCGNMSQDSFVVTVINNSSFSVTCPPEIIDSTVCDISGVAPYADFAAFMSAGGSASNDCDNSGTFQIDSYNDVEIGGSCPKTVNRTYVISDGNGNLDSCVQMITIIDNEAPTFTVPADYLSLGCSVEPDTSITGNLDSSLIMDNCDSIFSISFIDLDSIPGTCVGEYSFDRVWIVEDQCNNIAQDTQTIFVIDMTLPNAICKDTVIYYLDADGEVPIAADSLDDGSFDTCSGLSFSADMAFVGCNQVGSPTVAIMTATDSCGNTDTCSVVVLALDTMAINLIAPPIDSIDCIGDLPPAFTTIDEFEAAFGSVNDNCPVSHTFQLISSDTTENCPYIVSRIYEYEDFSGNSDTALHTIHVVDDEPPMILTCPMDVTISELDICDTLYMFEVPTVSDNCGDVTITNDYTGSSSTLAIFSGGVTDIIFTVSDACGNSDTCSMTVTVDAEPQFTCPPLDDINSADDLPDYNTLQEFIDAGGVVNMFCVFVDSTFAYSNSFEIDPDSCTASITEMISIVDTSGSLIEVSKTTTARDTVPPEIGTCFTQFTILDHVTCEFDTTFFPPVVIDNFGVDTTYYSIGEFIQDTALVTCFAADFCGNIDSCEFNLVVLDPTSPDIAIDDITIMCDTLGAAPPYANLDEFLMAPGALAYDCRLDSSYFILKSTGMDSLGNIQRTYEIRDLSNQFASVTQTIFVMDITAPTLNAPPDITIDCDEDVMDLSITGTVDSMFFDNCMDIDTLIYIDSLALASCPLVNEVHRIWILSDNSGNEAQDTQIISLIDTVAPVFDSIPDPLANIDCDEDFPLMETLTATDACTGVNVVGDTLPFVVDLCAGYDVTYRWIATDGCQNSDTVTVTFSVNPDTTPPSLIDLNNMLLESEGDICGVPVDSVPGPLFEEDCSNFNLISNYTDSIYHLGMNNVEWTATNDCGVDTTVIQEIIVEDHILPIPICKDATVGITADPQNYVFASSFIDMATDNCGVDSIFVRRMTAACDDPTNDVFGDSIHICCEDVGITIDVEVRIVDESGNENFCDATLIVEDHRAPVVLEDLPDIVISCSYVFDTLQMDVFGSFTSDSTLREEIIIEDILYEGQDSIAGLDGLVSDECEVSIQDTTIVNLDQCSNGYIKRIFTFTDPSGNSSTSEQIIIIQDVSPFNEDGDDIEWPEDYTWNQCGIPAPDTSVSGAPIFFNLDKCAQVSASYKDQLFNYPTNTCPKVLRKWKVIDWCQYNSNVTPNPGLWEYQQFIFVENDIAPTILTSCVDTLVCAPNNECIGVFSHSIEAEDDCEEDTPYITYNYVIDVNSDGNSGNDLAGQSNSFTHDIESGIHEVTWTATDRCGNASSCSYTLTIKECKAPTAVCLVGLAIALDQTGEVELWASDVNQSSTDNCTSEDNLIFSFSSDTNDFGKVFDCDDLDTPQYIEMWVTDEEGNQSFCSTFVDVQDNNGNCDDSNDLFDPNSLQGKIATELNEAIPEAMVKIIGAEMDSGFMTEENGEYVFDDLNEENDYQVFVERDKDDREGVSTLDLVKIQRHILGLELLNSPYKLIAADINNNESISASDLVALRKLILGIDETFPDNESWRFVSKNDEMGDMNDPWPFTEDLILGLDPIESLEADFVGVKIGDVNNSVENLLDNQAIQNRNNKSLPILAQDRTVQRDDEIYVDFVSASTIELEALQMTIEWDKAAMNLIDIISVGINLEDAYVDKSKVNEGVMTIAWTSVESKTITEGNPLFQLILEGNTSFNLSENLNITSNITQALAYDAEDVEHDIELIYTERREDGLMLFQNRPNPFAFETMIEFSIPEEMEVTFKVFNGAGSLIYRETKYYEAGINSFKINDELGDHTGLLFLKMETAEFSDVKRMIRIE